MTRLRQEQGFSMVIVMIALTLGSLLTIAAFAAATGDFPTARKSQDRKAAYAAAESGIEYFNFRLSQQNTYWRTCGDGGSGQINRRTVPGTNGSYVIEFLPANGAPSCNPSSPDATMIDTSTSTFRIRSTGRDGDVYRSIIATYRREGLLDYIYYTTRETLDPTTYGAAWSTCDKVRSQRPSSCQDIVFPSFDEVKGPLHTDDDSLLPCGTPKFGRDDYADAIEINGPAAWVPNADRPYGCSGTPRIGTKSYVKTNAGQVGLPPSNNTLQTTAASDWRFTGKTTVTLNGGSMEVRNASGTVVKTGWPANGVMYVSSGSCSINPSPTNTTYNESTGCGNVWVSGDYTSDLTIAAANDIIVNGNVQNTGDAMLGLIADRFVRVYHPDCTSGPLYNARIDAAILSVQHSFIVDNYDCGDLGTLTVNGAIAQYYRGVVGKGDQGYAKNYNYDNRFRYRSPPFFLNPLSVSWRVVRSNEQVSAARPTGL
jgi:hypothetical protein